MGVPVRVVGVALFDDRGHAPEFLDRLERLRVAFNRPMPLSAGFRCPMHNMAVSETGATGPHTTGHAVDVKVTRGEAYALTLLACRLGFTGLGFAQKGAARYMHLDDLPDAPGQPRQHVWSY